MSALETISAKVKSRKILVPVLRKKLLEHLTAIFGILNYIIIQIKWILGSFRTNQSALSKQGSAFIYSRSFQKVTFRKVFR